MLAGSARLEGFVKRGFPDPDAARSFSDSKPFGDQLTCPPELVVGNDGLPAAEATTGLRGVKAGAGPLADQVTLKLPKCAEQTENQPASWRGGIDLLGQTVQADVADI